MKTRNLLILVLWLPLIISCKSSDDPAPGNPIMKYVVTSDRTDTITSASFKDWITILGDNFVDVKSIHVNDVEITLKDSYITKNEITFQIPEVTPKVINNLITLQTSNGVTTLPFIVNVPKPIVVPDRTASWLFDDPANLLKADIGQNLETGWRENVSPRVTHIPGPSDMTGFTSINGPSIPTNNKAVTVDKWHFLVANHGISPNGGGTRVNEYTLMIDFRVPALGAFYTFLQTNPADTDDGDIFINRSGAIGSGATGYSTSGVTANTWQRLVVSVKLGDKGWIKYYLDGKLVLDDEDMSKFQIDNSRYSLAPKIILFGDDDGDDAAIDVAEVAMWNVALSEKQIEKLETTMNLR